MTLEEFLSMRDTLPEQPGVYRYFDEEENWLYVGKAKNIKKRVSQYFLENKIVASRIKLMVKQIARIEVTIVPNENDALILENSLIKENQPKYNIRLKDDKTYPFIVIKNERFPRIFFTRKYYKDGSEYLGPYTSVITAKDIFNTITTLFPLRTCTLNLSKENVTKKKFRACLEFHIGNCLAPCEAKQTEEEYAQNIKKIKDILKGKFVQVKDFMSAQMEKTVDKLAFEEADKWKTKLKKLDEFETKSVIFNPKWNHILAVNIYTTESKCILNYLRVENGTIISSKSFEVERKLEESNEEVLEQFISQFLLTSNDIEEVVIPFELAVLPNKVRQVIPLLGDKKKLLDVSYINARSFAMTLFTDPKFEKKRGEFNILKELQDKLRLNQLPIHMECFDNSNIQGSNPVSACVVFKNGKPAKKDYRHFHVKTVEGPDDFASMKEIVTRRYKRMVDEGEELPQLIVIDGGKGQLSHALEALKELQLESKVTIVGIAKKLEEIYFKDDPIPMYIDKKSPALKLIQQMRDEAHRFGLSFHRQLRSKSMIQSPLNQIDGIGKTTVTKLLKKYKSITNMKEASKDDLIELIGAKRAEILFEFLNNIGTR
ncbi:MAG: excinuclease ABC subunit UvrC [Chitinophagales bacterium]|jgi:excinuclease ABC subunit C|nr:excinuclease ABC subunit UvrC [Sphingobacteriales bacterium]